MSTEPGFHEGAPRQHANGKAPRRLSERPVIADHPFRDRMQEALRLTRTHLGMDVAFVSEFVGDKRHFRFVDCARGQAPIRVGDVLPLERGYCQQVVQGTLPELIPDTSLMAAARAIPETSLLPIGAQVSVPIRLREGSLYGTFCCFSFEADSSLNGRDLAYLRSVADQVAGEIDAKLQGDREQAHKVQRIAAALRADEPAILFQPVFRLPEMTLVGAEALARFSTAPHRAPDLWFAEAEEVGWRLQLEMQAIMTAIARYRPVMQDHGLFLALNMSPETVVESDLISLLDPAILSRLVIEITEHRPVADYEQLVRALTPLRSRGVKVAVDDAGSGYASMRHVLNIAPDVVKLDLSLTRGIDHDRTRRALARAIIAFGCETGCEVVAEGVETEAELRTLRALGAHAVQGFHLGHPVPAAEIGRLLLRA